MDPTVIEPGSPDQATHALHTAEPLPPRERILLADPTHYEVTRADNPHTRRPDGSLNAVDTKTARHQWHSLKTAYETLGFHPEILEAEPGLPDLVFCRNTAWPYLDPDTEEKRVIPGRMRYDGRRGEVPLAVQHLETLGYQPTRLPTDAGPFECGGDLQYLGNQRLLLAGTGERTTPDALDPVAQMTQAPLIHLRLVDPDFYHLDTCLAVLDKGTLLWVPAAFDAPSQDLLRSLPIELIRAPETEARTGFAANLHCPDGETVIIDEANPETIHLLKEHGYTVQGLDTSEFRKAGGSIFCMTNQLW